MILAFFSSARMIHPYTIPYFGSRYTGSYWGPYQSIMGWRRAARKGCPYPAGISRGSGTCGSLCGYRLGGYIPARIPRLLFLTRYRGLTYPACDLIIIIIIWVLSFFPNFFRQSRLLVTDEPVEFENELVELPDLWWGEPAVSYKCTGRSSRLQEKYRSF